MQSPQKASVKANYIYNVAYQILTIIVPLATAPYVSRVLGADNIGTCSFVNANLIYFVLVGVFGLSTYSQFEVAKKRDDEKELTQFCVESMLTRFLTMSVSCAAYLLIYLVFGKEYHLFYLIGFSTLLGHFFDVTWICQGLENFKIITIRNTIIKLLSVALIFLLVRTEEDVAWYFLITCASVLIGNLSLYPYVRKYLDIRKTDHIRIVPHLKASLVFFLPSTASVIITTVDKLMIGWFTVGMVQNGYYEQAMKIENMVFMVFAALNITMRPRMAYLYKNNEIDEMNRFMRKSLSFVVFLALPIVAGLIQIADIFVPWFFGEGYDGVIAILQVMSSWIIIKSFSNCLLEQAILPRNGQMTFTKIIWSGAVLNTILNSLLIPRFSAVGAAVASLATEVLILVLTLYKTRKVISVRSLLPGYWKSLLSAAAMFIIIGIEKRIIGGGFMNTVIIIATGCAVYLGMECLLKDPIVADGVQMVKNKLKRS